MRASKHARTAPPCGVWAAKASRVVMAATRRPAPNARPWATATLILTPVKAPGPMLAAIPSSTPNDTWPSASTASTMPRICRACDRPPGADRLMVSAPHSRATEQASVAVSMASTRMLDRLRRAGGHGRQFRQSFGEKHRTRGALGDDRARRQRLQKHLSVRLGPEPRIAEDDHAEIIAISNQAADTLFQRQHRLRQLVLKKRISAAPANAFQPCFEQRIVGRGERQLVDGDDGERLAFHIHPFPETARRQQHGGTELAEPLEQRFARRLTLHQYRKWRVREASLQRSDAFAQAAVAGVEQERAPAAGLEQRRAGLDEPGGKARIPRL